MINANELRRNNWILEDGKPIRVDEIRHWYFGDAEPIEITPEILEKAGFKYDAKCEWWENKVFDGFTMFSRGDHWVLSMARENQLPQEHFQYLHHLQNLYLSLTGEELTINL